jgi:hypothetical protein
MGLAVVVLAASLGRGASSPTTTRPAATQGVHRRFLLIWLDCRHSTVLAVSVDRPQTVSFACQSLHLLVVILA